MKEEDTVGRISTGSGPVESKAGPDVKVLRTAVNKYCFVGDILFISLQDEYELETTSVLT